MFENQETMNEELEDEIMDTFDAELEELVVSEPEPVEETQSEPVEETQSEPLVGTVKTYRLNLRSESNADSEILCVLNEGDEVVVAEEIVNSTDGSSWYKIYTKIGLEGFCMSRFVDVNL